MVTRKELFKLQAMANRLIADATLLSTTVLGLAEQEDDISSLLARPGRTVRKLHLDDKPKMKKQRKAKRGGKRTKKDVAAKVEEAPKAEDKK